MTVSELLINKLSELKGDNSISSYSHIKNILYNQLIPIPYSEDKPFKLIRYRRHNDCNRNKLFDSSEDLTYRKDILDIRNFGRANEPGQGFFYCNDNFNQNTGIAEIVSMFRGNENSEEEVLTIGAWNVKESLKLAIIVPQSNTENQKELEKIESFYNQLVQGEELEDLKNFINFIAKEYSLDIEKDKSNYKITSAFSNYIRDNFPEIDGIIYSSMKSEHTGTNIVLWPETADKKLEFVAARKSVFKRKKDKTYIEEQIVESKDYDIENDKINWE